MGLNASVLSDNIGRIILKEEEARFLQDNLLQKSKSHGIDSKGKRERDLEYSDE